MLILYGRNGQMTITKGNVMENVRRCARGERAGNKGARLALTWKKCSSDETIGIV